MVKPTSKPNQRQPTQSPSRSQTSTSKAGIAPVAVAIAAILGAGFVVLPRIFTASQSQVSSPVAAVRMQNNNDVINVYWGNPTTRQEFWFDGVTAPAKCDANQCEVPKRPGIQQVYFRWLNTTENRWYYFQCPANYSGRFQGIPYTK
jgi:hypothetical protein